MLAYKVKSGDTLSKISRRFNVSLDAIVQLNGIRNPDRMRVGQILQIPENTTDSMDVTLPPVEPVPDVLDTGGEPTINRTRFQLPAKEYIPTVVEKDLIVLHFTAGRSAKSAFQTWLNSPARVATAYVVDPNGKICELFDPSYWAFHLGIKGTGGKHDRRSIGIEIANVGPLKVAPNNPNRLNWWPNEWGTRYCRRDETSKYLETRYRDIDFFASMPDEQIDSVGQLVHHLCERFDIPKRIPSAARRMECDVAHFSEFQGVAAHQNFRKDKWDVGPAFDWDRLGF